MRTPAPAPATARPLAQPAPAATTTTRTVLPERFGPYLLVERIGEGGMAEVFLAKVFGSEGFVRTLVIKRMRADTARSPELVRMFTDEAKITALLDHPNVVRVIDFGHVGGRPFIALEYLEGMDLAAVMRALRPAGISLRGPLVARIALDIARGLDHAHTARDRRDRPCAIVHRDVNPANIMLLRTGGVKVLDFGVAKAAEHLSREDTETRRVRGKLGYVSPEQAMGEPLDGRSDLFSLGVTMWELLTGERLFAAKRSIDRIRKVLHAPIVPPSARRPAVHAALDRIVLRALERDRERRYACAAEMADDLDRFLAEHPSPPEGVARLLERLPLAQPVGMRAAAARARAALLLAARRRVVRFGAVGALLLAAAIFCAVRVAAGRGAAAARPAALVAAAARAAAERAPPPARGPVTVPLAVAEPPPAPAVEARRPNDAGRPPPRAVRPKAKRHVKRRR
jgi:serine/threonine-protein kinase